jgi:hypothetical protein
LRCYVFFKKMIGTIAPPFSFCVSVTVFINANLTGWSSIAQGMMGLEDKQGAKCLRCWVACLACIRKRCMQERGKAAGVHPGVKGMQPHFQLAATAVVAPVAERHIPCHKDHLFLFVMSTLFKPAPTRLLNKSAVLVLVYWFRTSKTHQQSSKAPTQVRRKLRVHQNNG